LLITQPYNSDRFYFCLVARMEGKFLCEQKSYWWKGKREIP